MMKLVNVHLLSKSLLVCHGTRQVNEVSSSSGHEYITVLTACSAAGDV